MNGIMKGSGCFNTRQAYPLEGANMTPENIVSYRHGNKNGHGAAQRRRPSPIFLEIEGEPCVKVPLQPGKWAVVSLCSYPKIKNLSWLENKGYATARNARGKQIRMHRVIRDTPDGMTTDHINHDTLDNRDCNLRDCTQQQNMFNRSVRPNKSEFRGVTKQTLADTWLARIQVCRKPIYLGTFKTREEAHEAYREAAKIHFGEFANNG